MKANLYQFFVTGKQSGKEPDFPSLGGHGKGKLLS